MKKVRYYCKCIAENYLLSLNFKNLFIFRPGYIYHIEKRKEPNIGYVIYRWLYKIGLLKISKNLSITSKELAHVMLINAITEIGTKIFKNKDIKKYFKNTRRKEYEGILPPLAVSGPYGAVKEQ